jgi:zinc transporter ZupT
MMASQSDRSISVLLSDAFGQLSKLISNEFELMRAEASDKISQIARAGAMIGAGAVLAIPALVILLMAAAEGLVAAGLSSAVSYLIIGVLAAAIAGALVMIGLKRMTPEALKPHVTIDQLQRDKNAAKEMVR